MLERDTGHGELDFKFSPRSDFYCEVDVPYSVRDCGRTLLGRKPVVTTNGLNVTSFKLLKKIGRCILVVSMSAGHGGVMVRSPLGVG